MFVPHINTLYRRIQSTHTAFLLFGKTETTYTQLGNYILMFTKRMLNIAKNKIFVPTYSFCAKEKYANVWITQYQLGVTILLTDAY